MPKPVKASKSRDWNSALVDNRLWLIIRIRKGSFQRRLRIVESKTTKMVKQRRRLNKMGEKRTGRSQKVWKQEIVLV